MIPPSRRPPTWRACPLCGAVNRFGVARVERVYAVNHLQLSVESGHLVGVSLAASIPDWNTRVIKTYVTTCCHKELPAAYQDVLDEALDITRHPRV